MQLLFFSLQLCWFTSACRLFGFCVLAFLGIWEHWRAWQAVFLFSFFSPHLFRGRTSLSFYDNLCAGAQGRRRPRLCNILNQPASRSRARGRSDNMVVGRQKVVTCIFFLFFYYSGFLCTLFDFDAISILSRTHRQRQRASFMSDQLGIVLSRKQPTNSERTITNNL